MDAPQFTSPMQQLKDRLLSPESLQKSGVATLASRCGVLGAPSPASVVHSGPAAGHGDGRALEPSDAAVDNTTDVVRRAKRTLRRTVGSATESMSVQGGDGADTAAGETRTDDSDADDAPASCRGGARQPHKSNASGKGLRQMAVSVVNVVKDKGIVSYLEVGDLLVRQLLTSKATGKEGYSDEKNVRRRVYDALNVLKAADIIVQGPGRDLMWKGLPNEGGVRDTTQEDADVHELRTRKRALLEQTKRQLDNVVQLIDYQHTLKRVVLRNCEQRPDGLEGGCESESLTECTIPYPFVLLQTHLQNTVNIQHSDDRMQYDLDFGRGALAMVDPLGVLTKPSPSNTTWQESRSAFGAPQPPVGVHHAHTIPPPPPPLLRAQDRAASAPGPLCMPDHLFDHLHPSTVHPTSDHSRSIFGELPPMGGIPIPADMHSPPLPSRAGMPHDKTSWGHGSKPSPRLHHSQSFCAAEALTQFWREEGTCDAGMPTTDLLRGMPAVPDWSTPKGGMYVLQPPPPPPLGLQSQGLFSPAMPPDSVECDSSMLSHATPLKPLHEHRRVGRSMYES